MFPSCFMCYLVMVSITTLYNVSDNWRDGWMGGLMSECRVLVKWYRHENWSTPSNTWPSATLFTINWPRIKLGPPSWARYFHFKCDTMWILYFEYGIVINHTTSLPSSLLSPIVNQVFLVQTYTSHTLLFFIPFRILNSREFKISASLQVTKSDWLWTYGVRLWYNGN